MTCIVGIKGKTGIYIGGDSAISDGDQIQIMSDKKVWSKGQFLFGYAGDLRTGQVIKYRMKIPPINGKKPMEYMVTSFTDAMRKSLKKAGAAREENKEEEHNNQFLIGFRGRLFEIDPSYAACEMTDEYVAIGSGNEYALGSLHTTKDLKPEERILKALEAAAYFTAGVSPPFHIVKAKNSKR